MKLWLRRAVAEGDTQNICLPLGHVHELYELLNSRLNKLLGLKVHTSAARSRDSA